MSGRRVALTGATGFLGRRLVCRLANDGWRVTVLARRRPGPELWEGAAADVVLGDLDDQSALKQLIGGADAIVHAAGLIKARTRREFFAVNEGGARRVAELADGRRLILVSSLAAREPQLSHYAASKWAGELAVQAVANDALTVVRPPAIYGPGDRETLALFKAAAGPLVVLPDVPAARFAVAEVDDVAGLITRLIDSQASERTVTIGGDRPTGYSLRELAAAAAAAVGGRPLVLGAPAWSLKAAGAMSEFQGRWRDSPPIFTRGKAAEALHGDWAVSASEQGGAGDWSYTPLAEGFARTVAWYRANGWLR